MSGITRPLGPSDRACRDEVVARSNADAEAAHLLESIGGGEGEAIIQPAGDAHEHHPLRLVSGHKQRRAGGGGHGTEPAEFRAIVAAQGGSDERFKHPSLEFRRYEKERSHRGDYRREGEPVSPQPRRIGDSPHASRRWACTDPQEADRP